jgi:hypothetical protein
LEGTIIPNPGRFRFFSFSITHRREKLPGCMREKEGLNVLICRELDVAHPTC